MLQHEILLLVVLIASALTTIVVNVLAMIKGRR